jgi:hypothetical protein
MSELTMIPVLHGGYIPCANCTLVAVVPFRAPATYEPAPVPNATHVLMFPEGIHAEVFCEPCARMLAECFS